MDIYSKMHVLDGLDQLSIENLQAGRITGSAMAYAVLKCGATISVFSRERLGGCMGGNESDRFLADVLNDMFEAARFKKEEAEKPAGPQCVKCGKSFDDHDDETCPPGNKMLAVGEEHAYVVLANHNKMLMYAVEPEGIEAWRLRNLTLSSIEENGLMGMAHNPNLLTPTNHIILSERDIESAMHDYYRTRALKTKQAAPRDWICTKCGQNTRDHNIDGSCRHVCLPDPQEKKYRYRVVYSDATGMPVEWLTNKIETQCGLTSGIKFTDHNGKERICMNHYKVTDLMPEQPTAEDECPSCHNGTLERVGGELRCRGECGGIFATCPNCGRVAPKHYGMVACDGCGANWPVDQKTKIDKVLDTLHLKPKKKFTLDDLKKVSWDGMAEDVSKRIHLLGSLALVAEKTPLMDKIAEDLILPNIRLLAEFCENVEIKE
jgi:hypothetical protein